MLNAGTTALNHFKKVTLIVDDGTEREFDITEGYPTVYQAKDGIRHADTPMPIEVRIQPCEGEDSQICTRLYTSEDIVPLLRHLRSELLLLLQAAIVNEKQRKALEDMVSEKIDKTQMDLFRRDWV